MKYLAIVLAVLLAFPHPAAAAWRWIGGAELNSITDGVEVTTNSAPIATSSTQAHSGTYSWRVNAGAGFQRQVFHLSNVAATSTLRAWVYVAAYPNAATQFLRFSNSTNVMTSNITMNTDGTLVLLRQDGAQVGSASSAIPLDTWTCVELASYGSALIGNLEARVDGVTFASGANSAQGATARALWGNITGAQTTNDVYFDDIAVVTRNDPQFPGCGSTVFMTPNGDGDAHAWLDTAGSAGTANNYQLVDEIPPNNATDFVNSGTLNAEDSYAFSDSGLQTYDTVNAVAVSARYNNNTADATTAFKVLWRPTSGASASTSAALIPNSTTWGSYGVQATKNDSSNLATSTSTNGAALTSTILDAMQAGVIISAANVNRVQLTRLWAYADYTPGTPPVGTSNGDTILFE